MNRWATSTVSAIHPAEHVPALMPRLERSFMLFDERLDGGEEPLLGLTSLDPRAHSLHRDAGSTEDPVDLVLVVLHHGWVGADDADQLEASAVILAEGEASVGLGEDAEQHR